jgi:hypothetical protein
MVRVGCVGSDARCRCLPCVISPTIMSVLGEITTAHHSTSHHIVSHRIMSYHITTTHYPSSSSSSPPPDNQQLDFTNTNKKKHTSIQQKSTISKTYP